MEKKNAVAKVAVAVQKVAEQKSVVCVDVKDKSALYKELTKKRDDVVAALAQIEEECEGIDNKANADKVRQLNAEKIKLSVDKDVLQVKVTDLERRLTDIGNEIAKLSAAGVNRILEAIGKQRWYFFKNKTKVLMDRDTGLLWANLQKFPYCDDNGGRYGCNKCSEVIRRYNFDIKEFEIPTCYELWNIAKEKNFPFQKGLYASNNGWRIIDRNLWVCKYNQTIGSKDLDDNGPTIEFINGREGMLLPCSRIFVKGTDYEKNVAQENRNYSKIEKLGFTLNLFVNNDLIPVFDDAEITELFKKIYVEKPRLLKQQQELEAELAKLKQVEVIGADFDYAPLLADYDLEAVNTSVIKYYQAVQKWIDMLMDKVEKYENQNADLLNDFNALSVQLANKYQDSDKLTEEENKLLAERQEFLYKKLNLGMNEVKNKLLVLRKEADALEDRLEAIDEGSNPLRELAELEREPRPSFEFVTENSAKILKNALNKLEYFKGHRDLFKAMIEINKECADEYLDFKTSDYEALRNVAEKSRIKENVWQGWYKEWQELRLQVEKLYLPLFAYALEHEFVTMNKEDGEKTDVFDALIDAIKKYSEGIREFYLRNRKALYQKNFSAVSGEFVEKVQLQQGIFEYTKKLQQSLQKIIFSCENSEDRIFILRWANGILNLQVDAVIDSIRDKFADKVNNEILDKLLELRQRNLEVFLNDAKAYAESCQARENEFNDLIFQMQQGLE